MRILFALVLTLAAAWGVAAVAAEVVSRFHKPRGEFIDIGGRKLRLVCEGPRSDTPTVWLEAGAFSGAADFAAIQQELTARGLRSCAYDRAGLGYADTGPKPRDGEAIVADLEKLIAASGEPGPFILTGHSMAGLYMRLYAVRNPDKVAGMVLLDAATPQMIDLPEVQKFRERFATVAKINAVVGTLGLTKPLYLMGDRIGLPPQGKAEKRRAFISGRHARGSLAEVESWRAAALQAAAAGPLPPQLPVALVTAGPPSPRMATWRKARLAAASHYVLIDNIDTANHRTMLGKAHASRVVDAIQRVAAAVAGG